jgi:hypothetical protein
LRAAESKDLRLLLQLLQSAELSNHRDVKSVSEPKNPAKSHVKPQKPQNSTGRTAIANKPKHLRHKNKSGKSGILVSLNPLK